MNFKELEKEICFREIRLPNIFGETVRQFSATFASYSSLNPLISSNYPGFSRKRLSEFLAGRICALKALNTLIPQHEILPIGKSKMPLWPPGITGSITHTENMASAVVLPSNLNIFLGLDLEVLFKKNTAEELEREVLLGSEIKYLNPEKYPEIVTLIYSAKEAAFKAINSIDFGFFDFKEIELTSLNFSTNYFEARIINAKKPTIKGKFAFFDSMVLTGAEIIV